MSLRCLGSGSVSGRLLPRPQQRFLRPAAAAGPCVCARANVADQHKAVQQPQRQPSWAVPISRLLGCGAAAAALLLPLLPASAAESFDYLSDTYLDPSLAESPDILNTLLIVVVTYFTVMLLYLWLSSFLDDELDQSPSDSKNSSQPPPDQRELPPGYGSFLDAHVRSYVDPAAATGQHRVRALQQLGQAVPLDGETLEQLKGRLAAGAAEALEQQIRDVDRLVRTKLLSRKLGYTPNRSTATSKTSSSSSSSSSSTTAEHQQQQQQQQQQLVTPADIGAMLSAAVLNTPGGLGSWQHRVAIDALIDTQLDALIPPGGGAFHDDLIVRQVMRRVVGHLVLEESLLLLEGVGQGKRALEAAGRGGKPAHNRWALW